MKINRIGVDLAKSVFQVQGVDHQGKPVWKRQLPRHKWLSVLTETLEPGTEPVIGLVGHLSQPAERGLVALLGFVG